MYGYYKSQMDTALFKGKCCQGSRTDDAGLINLKAGFINLQAGFINLQNLQTSRTDDAGFFVSIFVENSDV